MKSVIITKCQKKENVPFSAQIEIHNSGSGNFEDLKKFVKHCHKNADTIEYPNDARIEVFTKRNHYHYQIFKSQILRIDHNQKKVYYTIS